MLAVRRTASPTPFFFLLSEAVFGRGVIYCSAPLVSANTTWRAAPEHHFIESLFSNMRFNLFIGRDQRPHPHSGAECFCPLLGERHNLNSQFVDSSAQSEKLSLVSRNMTCDGHIQSCYHTGNNLTVTVESSFTGHCTLAKAFAASIISNTENRYCQRLSSVAKSDILQSNRVPLAGSMEV